MALPGRRIVLQKNDVVVYKGFEFDTEVLKAICNPDARLFWAFIRNGQRIQPVAYSEDKVIWIEPADLERTEDVTT